MENHLFLLFQASFPPVSLFQPLGTQLYPSSPFVLSCSLHPLSPESTSAFTCTKASRQDLLLGYPTRDSDPLLWLWLSWPTAAESALPGDCVATIIHGCPCGHRSLAIRAPSSPAMSQILYGFCPGFYFLPWPHPLHQINSLWKSVRKRVTGHDYRVEGDMVSGPPAPGFLSPWRWCTQRYSSWQQLSFPAV